MDSKLFSLGKYEIHIVSKGYSILESEASSIKIQRFIRSLHRNSTLRKLVLELHHLCSLPFVRPAELEYIKAVLTNDPTLKMIRNKWKNYCTLTQSSLIGCNVAVLSLLNPTFRELIEVDSNGRSSIHYLSFSPNMKVAMCLAGILNAVTAFLPVAIDCSDSLLRTAFSVDNAGNISYCIKVVKVGWLMKQSTSRIGFSRWQKRWVVLCEDSISYYNTADTCNCKPKFTLNLANCTVKRDTSAPSEHIIEIVSDEIVPRKGFFSRSRPRKLILKASSEAELQSWMKFLVGLTGSVTPLALGGVTTRYVNHELRERWVSAKDANKDTALHIMVRHNKNRNMEAVKQIAWLVDNGCPINAQNAQGQTALHMAVIGAASKDIIRSLLSKGADVCKLQDLLGRTAMDIAVNQLDAMASLSFDTSSPDDPSNIANSASCDSQGVTGAGGAAIATESRSKQVLVDMFQQHHMEVQRYEQYYLFAEDNHNLRLFTGYTYLSIYMGKMSFPIDGSSDRGAPLNPYIRVSVMNGRHELIEDVQEIWNPTMVRPGMIYWGWSWHMSTPLENLQESPAGTDGTGGDSGGAYLVFESREKDFGKDDSCGMDSDLICRVKFPIDFQTLNSGPKTLRAESKQQLQHQQGKQRDHDNFLFPSALSCESSDEGAHLSIDIILSHGTSGC